MSEFLECQNCGRRFFGDNIECPYCRDDQVAREAENARAGASGGHLFRFLFACFHGVLLGIVVVAGLGLRQPGPARAFLGVEAVAAAALLVGLMQRRRWARRASIVFIVANAALGVLDLLQRGAASALAWGPGPLGLLLFLLPFCSRQARERYDR